MSNTMLAAIRKMSGNRLPIIDLSEYEFNDDSSVEFFEATKEAVKVGFEDFLHTYDMNWREYMFRLENIIHYTITHDFEDVFYVKGVDIKYSDITVHFRFVLDGIDTVVAHSNVIATSSYKTKYNHNEVNISFEKYRTSDSDEYWQYTINA